MQAIIPTPEAIRTAYIEFISKRHQNQDAEAFVQFAERDIADFIRKYVDANFASIYECTDHYFYDNDVRAQIHTNSAMKAEDDASGNLYWLHLKAYSDFLQSKAFRGLIKQKINIEGPIKKMSKSSGAPAPTSTTTPSPTPSKPKERQMTEGEKKHREYEAAQRNPALRQACIDKYGYQCQCCGMNFADLYGEELGGCFIEVHHLKMIATYDEQRPDDYLENLVPLCSNCHSMIHHGADGPLTLRELREAYKGEKKEIKIWKED